MTDLGPGEVMKRFEGDLQGRAEWTEECLADVAETARALESAQTVFDQATERFGFAISSRDSTRNLVISALEATDSEPGDEELCSALMSVKGKSEEEIKAYFAHLGGLAETEQPVVIVKSAGELATPSIVAVVYGQTVAGEDGHAGLTKIGQEGSRSLQIPLKRKIGFGSRGLNDSTGRGGNDVFTGLEGNQDIETVSANPGYPFEEVHFAASAREVEEVAEMVKESDTRELSDGDALKEFSLPTLVAYGEDAVRAVTWRIAKMGETHNLFARRSIEEIGLPPLGGEALADVEISDELAKNLRLQFYRAISSFMNERYSTVSRGDRVAGPLEFLAPLLDKVGLSEVAVADELKHSLDRGLEVKRNSKGNYAAWTRRGPRATHDMELAAKKLAEFGIAISPDSDAVKRAGYELEINALDSKLRHGTLPLIDPLIRHRLKRDLREMRLAALPLDAGEPKQ